MGIGDGAWDDSLYTTDPASFAEVKSLPASQQAGLIGIEACMWAESVDHTNVLQRVWPRASATAERAWSSRNTTIPPAGLNNGYVRGPASNPASPSTPSSGHQAPAHVLQRIHAHRCRLLMRGIDAEPVHFGQAVGFGTWGFGQGLCPQDEGAPRPE